MSWWTDRGEHDQVECQTCGASAPFEVWNLRAAEPGGIDPATLQSRKLGSTPH